MAGDAILEKDGTVGVVPGAVQAEFGKRPLSKEVDAELKALEAEIVAAANGTAAAAKHPAPAAPVAQVPQTAPVAEAPAPVAPVAPQAIPEKFRNPDGSLNQDAVNQSAANAQAALQAGQNVAVEDFLALEKKLTLERQQAAALASQAALQQFAPPQAQQPAYQPPVALPPQAAFLDQLNKDIAANPAQAFLNLQQAALQVSQDQYQSIQKRMELEALAKKDPGVFTKQGLEELAQVRAANPWIDNAPNPWSVAYEVSGRKHRVAQSHGRPVAPVLPGNQAPPAAQTYQAPAPILDAASLLNAVKNQVGASNYKAQHETLENLINAAARRAGGA